MMKKTTQTKQTKDTRKISVQKTNDLKNRQIEILYKLFSFRFLTTKQIQLLLNHKHKEQINEWLQELTKENYIFRFYDKQFAGKPAVYCLDKASVKFLRKRDEAKGEIDEKILKRIYKEKSLTEGFRNHWVLVGHIYLTLQKLTNKINCPLTFHTQTDLDGMEHLISPAPDAYIAIKESKRTIKRYFLDVFNFHRPWKEYKGRVKKYVNYYNSNEWQENTNHPFPEIILICPEKRIQTYIAYWVKKSREEDKPQFYTSTWQEVQEKGMCNEILQKAEYT